MDAKWLGNSLTSRSVTAVNSTLTLIQDGTNSEYQFDGVVLDAKAGWAVAVISADAASIESQNATASAIRANRALAANGTTLAAVSAASGPLKAIGANTGTLRGYANHSISLKADGSVSAWGENQYGQLGDGTVHARLDPTCVAITGVISVATGSNHSVAVRSDQTVWTWGDDGQGQLGNGASINTSRSVPIMVPGLTGVIAVAAGQYHTLALKNDGTVWAWGFNGAGQLGDGSTTTRQSPVQVSGLTGITAIAAGDSTAWRARATARSTPGASIRLASWATAPLLPASRRKPFSASWRKPSQRAASTALR